MLLAVQTIQFRSLWKMAKWCIILFTIYSSIIFDSVVVATDANVTESRLSQLIHRAWWNRFQLDSEQPALVRAAANLVVNFRDRGNAATVISAEAYVSRHRDHMDILNSFARRVNPIIALTVIDVELIRKETYKTQLNIFVVDGVEAFK